MTTAERNELQALDRILETTPCGTPKWDEAYERYLELRAIEQEEYYLSNIGNLRKFYDDHIANRGWDEIDPDAWSWYSDYHKDVFGYRPRTLNFPE